ncbi:MAG: erythromycin esterase family protein [Clostridia bacterium]|nr:erythromycin esterase family protein [Clostridia bacterium]
MSKKKKVLVITTLILVVAVLAVTLFEKKPSKIDDFATYAADIGDITIPDNVKVVALGEATHGNIEFQELKLTVFKQLVETTDIRAFALEGDFGGCALINDYIQGGDGDINEITRLLGYRIYRTESMKELIEWMRDYNENTTEEDRVRIYGIDIQYDTRCLKLLSNFYATVDSTKAAQFDAESKEIFGEEDDLYNPNDYDQIISWLDGWGKDIESNNEAYTELTSEYDVSYASRAITNLKYYLDYREKENYGSKYRDNCMFENVNWILNEEGQFGRSCIMLSGHNGHLTKNLSTRNTYLGNQLYEELGEAYFAIGTDYYYTNCNLPKNGERINAKFCSNDPLAYQLHYLGKNTAYLDFAKARESQELSKLISERMSTGTLGEQYSLIMEVMPNTTHIYCAPEDMFDAMIFVYEANPIVVWDK